MKSILCVSAALACVFASAAPAFADPIAPAPEPVAPGATPVIVVATPGSEGGEPTLVISPPADVQPEGPDRVTPIGGARISTNVPVQMGPGNGRPLLGSQPRTQATVPVWARNGVFLRTNQPGKDLRVQLPEEMSLAAAEWGPNGMATYRNDNADYTVAPLPDGGADFTIRRTNQFSTGRYQFLLRLPAGTHWVAQGSATVIKTNDEGPQHPSTVIGTFSAPTAKNGTGGSVPVSVVVTPLAELVLEVDTNAQPTDITFNYHPAP